MIFKREQEKDDLKHQQVVRQVWHHERQKEGEGKSGEWDAEEETSGGKGAG